MAKASGWRSQAGRAECPIGPFSRTNSWKRQTSEAITPTLRSISPEGDWAEYKRQAMSLAIGLGLIAMVASVRGQAQTESVLYSFAGPANGGSSADAAQPYASLVRDASGNLYGTTQFGGTFARGTVFELVNSSGSYMERVLYNFKGGSADGAGPVGGLVIDSSGNLYGTTTTGGASPISGTGSGPGTVFELVNTSGTDTEKVLHKFDGLSDGAFPQAGLVMDPSGNLYGTTLGTVFELVNSSGGFTEKTIYSFTGLNNDGGRPYGRLVIDTAGNLYGTTSQGGNSTLSTCFPSGCGTVFELVNSSGSFTEKVIYIFGSIPGDGAFPHASLIMDAAGNLYCTTTGGVNSSCSAGGCGTVFELVNSSGNYTEKVLYRFAGPDIGGGKSADGAAPWEGVLMDTAGNLYGTTAGGSVFGGTGIVFELLYSSGSYTEKVLYNFTGTDGDGRTSYAGLTADASGSLYGTTTFGGAFDFGTVFEINPNAKAPAATLSASKLTLSAVVNVKSAPQSTTITNSGSADLILGAGAVTLSGMNAADFALSANACSEATIAFFGTCSVSVTFTPSFVGIESATLSFSDNAATSPQKVILSGTGFSAATVSLSPSHLDFGVQATGTTSSPQTVTLMNTGTGALGSISISTQGTNFSETNNCGTSVPQGANCVTSVTYKATAAGSSSGILAIGDDAADSPQTVTLAGDSGDFSIAGFSSVTISPGQTANYSLLVASEGALAGTVNLTCSGAPSQATCTVNPNSLTMNAGSATTVIVQVTTTGASFLPQGRPTLPPPNCWLTGLWTGLVVFAITRAVSRKAAPMSGIGRIQASPMPPWDRADLKARARGAILAPALLRMWAIVLCMALSASCGGGATSTVGNPGTPAGTYNLTVTGTLASGTSTLNHNIQLTLTVN